MIINVQILMFDFVIISSQADNLCLMLKQPTNWQEVLTSSNNQHITEVDIHLGLPISKEDCQQQQWEECIRGVIDTAMPQIICVYLNYINHENIENVFECVNQKHYLMQIVEDNWHICYRYEFLHV